MKWVLRVYSSYIKISFSTAAAYRADFFFISIMMMLRNLLIPLLTALIYMGGASIPGWTLEEALMIQSVFMLCTGICAPFFNNMIWITMQQIREGTYDMILLKPGSAAFLTAASAFDISNIGLLLGGVAMFIYSIFNLPYFPGLLNWLQFALLGFMGICMTLGCILIMTASTFKWVGNGRIFEINEAITMFGRYPGTVFSNILQGRNTFIIPVAMMGYFPAAAIMGRADAHMMLAIIPCLAFLAIGCLVFNRMIRLYQSAGG
jgi:ABC-2 type transport system permease protein